MKRSVCRLLLVVGLLTLQACATLPEQPEVSAPYAVLEFPASMQLLTIDQRPLDARLYVRTLRVRPGEHILRFVHLNAGADGSPAHAGQHAAPFTLQAQAGGVYRFESKTCGIIWRPAVAASERIPGYCATHACTEVVQQQPAKGKKAADCN